MRNRKSSFRKEGEKFYYKLSTCFIEIPKKRKCAGTLSETISRSLGKPASQLISFVRMYSGPCCFSHTALSLYHFLSEAYISLLWHKHMTINSHIYILEFIQSQFKNPQKLFRAHEPHFQTPGKKFMRSSWVRSLRCNIILYLHHYQIPVLWDISQIRLPATYFLKSLKCQTSLLDHTESHHKNNLYLEIVCVFFNAFFKIGFSVKPVFFVCPY